MSALSIFIKYLVFLLEGTSKLKSFKQTDHLRCFFRLLSNRDSWNEKNLPFGGLSWLQTLHIGSSFMLLWKQFKPIWNNSNPWTNNSLGSSNYSYLEKLGPNDTGSKIPHACVQYVNTILYMVYKKPRSNCIPKLSMGRHNTNYGKGKKIQEFAK